MSGATFRFICCGGQGKHEFSCANWIGGIGPYPFDPSQWHGLTRKQPSEEAKALHRAMRKSQ